MASNTNVPHFEHLPSHTSFGAGLFWSGLLTFPLWFIFMGLSEWAFGKSYGVPSFITALGFAAVYFVACLWQVPIQHRGVLTVLGTRKRVGPNGLGLTEGLKWVWLPRPFVNVETVEVTEQTFPEPNDLLTRDPTNAERLADIQDYSKDNILCNVQEAVQWVIKDPYRYMNFESPYETLRAIILRASRKVLGEYTARKLKNADTVELSDRIRELIENDRQGDPSAPLSLERLGIEIRLVRIPNIEVSPKLSAAWEQNEVEKEERKYEKRQARARKEQIDALVASGMSAAHAANVALVDAGKTGATTKHVHFELGEAEKIANNLGRGLSTGLRAVAAAIASDEGGNS